MAWNKALTTAAVVVAALATATLVGASGASAQQPGVTADSEWSPGECPHDQETAESMHQQMGHDLEGGLAQGMMSGDFGTMTGPDQMMGSGMGG